MWLKLCILFEVLLGRMGNFSISKLFDVCMDVSKRERENN